METLLWFIVTASAAWIGYKAVRSNPHFARLLTPIPSVTAIRDARDGPVVVEGKVVCESELLTAPISGRPCVLFDVIVEDTTVPPRFVMREIRGRVFLIDDGTGMAEIALQESVEGSLKTWAPLHVSCLLERDFGVEGGWFFDRRVPEIDALLTAHEITPPSDFLLNDRLQAGEAVLSPGDVIVVTGRGVREVRVDGVSPDFRTQPSRYVIRAAEGAPLTIARKEDEKVPA